MSNTDMDDLSKNHAEANKIHVKCVSLFRVLAFNCSNDMPRVLPSEVADAVSASARFLSKIPDKEPAPPKVARLHAAAVPPPMRVLLDSDRGRVDLSSATMIRPLVPFWQPFLQATNSG